MERWRMGLCGMVVLALPACGGGGGGGGNTPEVTTPRTVGGVVSGLNGSVVLQNNASGNLTVNSSGSFTFTGTVADGASYNVTVLSQPAWGDCTVTNGQGTASANISNVAVSCVYADPRIWGTPVARPVPSTVGFPEASAAILGQSGRLTLGAAYRNTAADPDVLAFLTTDFDLHTRLWSSFTQLSESGSTQNINYLPTLVSSSQADLITWQQPDTLRGALRASGGWVGQGWSGQHQVGQPDAVRSIALNDGTIYMVWADFNAAASPQHRLLYQILRNGSWSATLTASTAYAANRGGFRLASNGTQALLAWASANGALNTCVLGNAACESPLVAQAATANLAITQFAARADGNALLLWKDTSTFHAHVFNGISWSAAVNMGAEPGSVPDLQQVVSLPDGFLVMAKRANDLVTREYRTSWSGWQLRGAFGSNEPARAIADASGNVLLAWHDQVGSGPDSFALQWNRFEAATAQWTGAQTLAADLGLIHTALLAVDGRGNVLAAWYRVAGTDAELMAAVFDATTRQWGAITRLAANAYDPRIFFDAGNRGVALWYDDAQLAWMANTLAPP